MTAQLEETRLGVPPLLFLTKDGASRAPGRVVVRSAPVPTGSGAPEHDAALTLGTPPLQSIAN